MKYSQGKFDPKKPVITQSFLNMFSDCPYAAFRRYVQGEIIPPGVAALQGTSVDAAVTMGCEHKIETGLDAPLDDKKDLVATTFEKKLTDHKIEPEDDLGALKDQAVKLVEIHHKEISPKQNPVATQESIAIDKGDYVLAGTLDLIEKNDIIADTKTSKAKYNEDAINQNIQPTLYSTLYKEKHGKIPTAFRYDVLIKTKTPQAQQLIGKITQANEALLEHQINSARNELDSSLKNGVWRLAAPGHWRCCRKWCGYYDSCLKGKK